MIEVLYKSNSSDYHLVIFKMSNNLIAFSLLIALVACYNIAIASSDDKLGNRLKEIFNIHEQNLSIATESSAYVLSSKQLHRQPPLKGKGTKKTRDDNDIVIEKWIDQKLDNFDENESRTWKMRYLENDEFFEDGGPMFIFVGGEWTIEESRITRGHTYDMAKEHNGILFYTEHRFYGQSHPFKDLSKDSLKYLNVQQALADLAHFIRYQRESDERLMNSKVILVGGSYSASMTVWFKHLYPELIVGGWASSAPLEAKVDFREYMEVAGKSLRELGSNACYNRVNKGIAELEAMFAQKRGAEVKAMFKLCDNFDEHNDLDLWTFFGAISNIFAAILQYQEEGDVPLVCNYLMKFDDDVEAIGKFILLAFEILGMEECLDVSYRESIDMYADTNIESPIADSRAWYYQTCNEYGWYSTSSSRQQPFGTKFPKLFYLTICHDLFGKEYFEERVQMEVDATNEQFLGKDIEVENIYRTHGALDPWSAMGHGEEHGAVIIPKASHCNDMSSINDEDSDEMRKVKEQIAELVREWLTETKKKSIKITKKNKT